MHLKAGIILSLIFIVLQLLDGYSTWACLTKVVGREANPLYQFVFNKVGIISGLVMVKSPVVALIIVGAFLTRRPDYMLIATSIGYAAVVINNLRVLFSK